MKVERMDIQPVPRLMFEIKRKLPADPTGNNEGCVGYVNLIGQ
jgi:hypothetical protein